MNGRRAIAPLTACGLVFVWHFALLRESADFFWMRMALVCAVACVAAWHVRRGTPPEKPLGSLRTNLALGALSAVALYVAFAVGVAGVRWLWPPAQGYISSVYTLREGLPAWQLTLLLAALIGPAEEYFWRGALQRAMAEGFGKCLGWLSASTLYAAVHIAAGNPLLVLAALLCGLYWGAWYAWRRSLILNIVSHSLWDLAVFVWAPLS